MWVTCVANSGYHESRVFKNIDLKTLILLDSYKSDSQLKGYSTTVFSEYATKDSDAVLTLTGNNQKHYLSRIFAECTNRVAQLGGKIIGCGNTSSSDIQELMYETEKAKGQIKVLGTAVNETNLDVFIIIFECRR
jgi:hypothetical protein